MSKKFNWLDKFAQDQAEKQSMKKEASTKKVANQIIVNPEDAPNAQDGATIDFNGEQFKVVDANFSDDMGPGVVLEKAAAYEGLEGNPMDVSMGAPATSVTTPSTGGQEYHYTKLETQQTYDNDQDAQWGQSSAPATAQEIATENSVDRTTVDGRFTKSPGVNTAPAAPVAPVADGGVAPTPEAPAATPVTEAPAAPAAEPVTEAPAKEEAPVEETKTEEAPKEDAPSTDEPAEEKKEENKILSKVKSSIPAKKAKTTRTAVNATIINLASDVTDAVTGETEDILEDAEETIKSLVPSHLAAKALKLLEDELEEEGIEAKFDTSSLSKTAGEDEDCSEEDLKEIVKKTAEAVVDEMEGVLADADQTMDEERETLAEGEEQFELEAKLKAMVERKLHAKGIYTRFARTAKKVQKKTIAEKIREARKNRK